jgi:hypothetical protein
MHPHPTLSQPIRQHGFTLFEVALSLVLVSFSVVSVLVLFPLGIKSEQNARMQIYAAVKAEEIIDSFATSANTNPSIETEAPDSWDVPASYRVFSPDLESRIVSHRYGIMPLPIDIVRRLDSDDDEIARVVAEGGQIYYSQASGATGLEEATEGRVVKQPDALTQKLVFAVVGYAQSNNVSFLPWKAWPYYSPFPSPPGHGEKKQFRSVPADAVMGAQKFSYQGIDISLWEGVGTTGADSGKGTTDPDIAKVFDTGTGTPRFGFHPYALGGSNDLAGATAYLQAALWYCERKLGAAAPVWYGPMEPFTVATRVADRMTDFRGVPDDQKWKYVQAMRFLSHAATCITRHKNLADLGGQPSGPVGYVIPPGAVEVSVSSPQITLTHDKIVYYHELAMQMVMLYAASQPYDWGVPRPTQRALFTDYPLIEYDLFSPKLTGTITGTSEQAYQWRPVTARPITTIGRSYTYPDHPIPMDPFPGGRWGNSDNFTLAKPFQAMERCRQLVFWAVDWTSYEDFESAPSAPIDASKYLFSSPQGDDFATRMRVPEWIDHHVYQFRNPEKVITFKDSSRSSRILNGNGGGNDQGTGNSRVFLGQWGADRNFNGKFDRGTVPTSVRLRATPVARYNYYDPRLTLKLR